MESYIYLSVVLLLGILMVFIPLKDLRKMTSFFSFKKFGIRKKKRWNALIDDLGNCFLTLSFLFCVFYWAIPYFEWIYSVWILFTLLCTLARSSIITCLYPKTKGGRFKASLVNVLIFYVAGIGLCAGVGLFNQGIFYAAIKTFQADLQAGALMHYMYYLTQPTIFYILLEGLILFIPLMTLWNHFKYMRTERAIRAANIVTYTIKMLITCALVYGLARYGFSFLNMVYHLEYTFA